MVTYIFNRRSSLSLKPSTDSRKITPVAHRENRSTTNQKPPSYPKSRIKLLLTLNSIATIILLAYLAVQTQSSRDYTQLLNTDYNEFWIGINKDSGDVTENIQNSNNSFQITSVSLRTSANNNSLSNLLIDLFPFTRELVKKEIVPLDIRIAWEGEYMNYWDLAIVLPWDFCYSENQVGSEGLCILEGAKQQISITSSCHQKSPFEAYWGNFSDKIPPEILLTKVQVPNLGYGIGSTVIYDPLSEEFVINSRETEIKSAIIIQGNWLACAGTDGFFDITIPVKGSAISNLTFSDYFIKIKYLTSGWNSLIRISTLPDTFILRSFDSKHLGSFTAIKPDQISLRIISDHLIPQSIMENSITISQKPNALEYIFQPDQPLSVEFKDTKRLEIAGKALFFIGLVMSAALQILITYLWERN